MKHPLFEPLLLLSAVLFVLKMAQAFFPPSWVGFLAPLLLLYIPVVLYWREGGRFDFIDNNLNRLVLGVIAFLLTTLIVFPPYLVAAHYWMLKIFHFQSFQAASGTIFAKSWFYQLLVVALPEEFFFRGYFQDRLNRFFPPRWRLFGASLGWGWVWTALLFAFAHSVIQVKWWHFSIFFPALLFGYLRERTGSITAPVLFHAFCNSFVNWFAHSYVR